MNWKEAIDKFEERRLAIWEKMPQDVYNLSQGVVPGDTNVYGQYVMTALYADSEMRTLCDEHFFYMIETAKRWRVYSTSYGSQSETLWITDRCIHYCQNSMYAGGDCTITLRIPDRIQGRACEFYVVRFQTGWACKIAKPAGMQVYPVEGQDAFGLKGIGLHIWHFLEFKWNPNNQQDPRCFFVEYYNLNRDQNSSS